MPLASMTGFARVEGEHAETRFVWELRAVNGKGLDVRLRLPQGLEGLEPDIRKAAGRRLTRGNVQIGLQLRETTGGPGFIVNEAMLSQVLALSDRLVAAGHAVTPTADGLLGLKGIIDVAAAAEEDPDANAARQAAVLGAFGEALDRLVAARHAEGAALKAVLKQRLDEIEGLVADADRDPSRTMEAIRAKLAAQLSDLLASSERLDEQRLHQEAAMLAQRADIREELDRLASHVGAARALLAEGGAVGRRLDFLSQEFNREANTICAKSNAASLTAIGLELKVIVDQFREQVQNIE